MYVIVNQADVIACLPEKIKYVWRQSNGLVALTSPEKATAVYVADNDTIYPLSSGGWEGELFKVHSVETMPNEVVSGEWTYRNGAFAELLSSADKDLMSLTVDHEYRLTLMELGV